MTFRFWGVVKHRVCSRHGAERLRSLSSDSAGQLDIFRHDSHALGMDGCEIRVFEKTYEVSLGRFLKSEDGRSLETKISLEILGNLTNKPLEGELANEELSGLLVATDFAKSDSSGSVAMRLLHSSGGRRTFASSLGGELFAGCFSSS